MTSSRLPRLYTPAFWLACAIHVTGAMSLNMFLLFPLFVRAVGGDDAMIGLVVGVGMTASVLVRPAVGHLLDRLGRRPVLLGFGLLNALTFLPFLWLRAIDAWLFLAAAAHWVVWGALFAAYMTYASDLAPVERRAEGIAMFGVFGLVSIGAAPALGEAIVARSGFRAFFLVAAGLALLSCALTLLVRASPQPAPGAPHAGGGTRALARAVRRGGLARVLVATMILGAAVDIAAFFVAPFTRDLGLARAAPFFAAYAATSIGLRFFGRRLLDRLGAHRVSIPAFVVNAVGLALLARLPAPGLLVLAGVGCGAAHGTIFPVLNVLALARTPRRLQGGAVSLVTAAFDLGATVGTPLGGVVAQAAGYPTMFALTALVCLAAVGVMATDPWPGGAGRRGPSSGPRRA